MVVPTVALTAALLVDQLVVPKVLMKVAMKAYPWAETLVVPMVVQ